MSGGISRNASRPRLSNHMAAAKCAAWVHADLGSERSTRPSPMAATSSSEVKGLDVLMSVSCCARPTGAEKPAGWRAVGWIGLESEANLLQESCDRRPQRRRRGLALLLHHGAQDGT